MLSEKQIEIINKVLSKKVFRYSGPIFGQSAIIADFNYTIHLLGYKKMISFGEYRDFLEVDVIILKLNDNFTKNLDSTSVKHLLMNSIKHYLLEEIKKFLIIFTDSNLRVLLSDIKILDNEMENIRENIITETRMSRQGIRTVVRDIINIVKKGKKGFFYLPDDDMELYEFPDIPFTFNVELTLKTSSKVEGYKMNGFYSPEDDVIEIVILFNPKTIQKELYNMVGELNETIAHELEHGHQTYNDEFPDKNDGQKITDSLEYYTQEHEIPAQYQGFKRLSQLRKEPISVVAKRWFDTHKDIHGLTDDEVNVVLDKVLNYKK